jgi:hypothetical protein
MTTENEDLSNDMHYPGYEAEHIIRILGSDGMICDIAMTDAQLKETLHFIRTTRDDMMKLSFNDAVLELLRIGVVRIVHNWHQGKGK